MRQVKEYVTEGPMMGDDSALERKPTLLLLKIRRRQRRRRYLLVAVLREPLSVLSWVISPERTNVILRNLEMENCLAKKTPRGNMRELVQESRICQNSRGKIASKASVMQEENLHLLWLKQQQRRRIQRNVAVSV